MSHEIDAALKINTVHKNTTIVIKRGDVVDTVTADHMTRKSKAVKTKDLDNAFTPVDLTKKNTKSKKWHFKKIFHYEEIEDG